MNEQTQNILKWVLIGGIALAGVKVVVDLTKAPPTAPKEEFKPAASIEPSASSDQPLFAGSAPRPRPNAAGSGSAGANPLAALQTQLAAIAKDPEKAHPTKTMKDPQGSTLVYLFDIPGLKQAALITFVEKPDLWQWKFGSAVPAEMFSEDGQLEELKAPEEGVQARKILSGPLAGAVIMTVEEQPLLRIIHSPALWAQAMAEMAAQAASGSASGKPGAVPSGREKK